MLNLESSSTDGPLELDKSLLGMTLLNAGVQVRSDVDIPDEGQLIPTHTDVIGFIPLF